MSIRKISLGLLTILLVLPQASSQTAKHDCRGAGTIGLNVAFDDSYSSATLGYQFEQPDQISNAQIEVWDRPTRLFRTQVTKKKREEIVWTPNEETADTPLSLWIRVRDPQRPRDADEPGVLIGSTGPVDGGTIPKLLLQTIILEEGTGPALVTAKGANLGEHNIVILLMEEEGPHVWTAREYLPATLVDLGHVSVQIPSGYLSKPTRLQLEAMRPGDVSAFPIGSQVGGGFDYVTIYVMSRDRPVFSRIEPSTVRFDDRAEVMVRILGNGFTVESQVLTSFRAGDLSNALKPLFMSDRELQVMIPSYMLDTGGYADEPFNLWVRNSDDQHVSDPYLLTLPPTDELPLARVKPPSITSVSPYPVPLMDYRSPVSTLLKIYGDNFRIGDSVIVENGELNAKRELKAEFISPQELNAWLPRELWRSHRLSFRLITQTSSGTCAVEVWQDW